MNPKPLSMTEEQQQALDRIEDKLMRVVDGEPINLALAAIVMLLVYTVDARHNTPPEILAALSASLAHVQQDIAEALGQGHGAAAAPNYKESLH